MEHEELVRPDPAPIWSAPAPRPAPVAEPATPAPMFHGAGGAPGMAGALFASLFDLVVGALPPRPSPSVAVGGLNRMGFLEPGTQSLTLTKAQIKALGLGAGTYHVQLTQDTPATEDQKGSGAADPMKALRGVPIGDMHVLGDRPAKPDKAWKGELGSAGRYTEAQGAKQKSAIDAQLAADGVAIDPGSGAYWAAYIKAASKGKMEVHSDARGLQFFYLESGWEGFFPVSKEVGPGGYWKDYPASKNTRPDLTNADHTNFFNPLNKKEEQFDANRALVVFGSKGNLVFVSPILTVLSAPQDHSFKDGWDGRTVTGAKPAGYDYYGLSVNDGDDYFADIHPRLGTHGCYQLAPHTFDARYEGQPTGRADYAKQWQGFQEQYLEAHADVGEGDLTYDGVADSVTFSADITHLARRPKLKVVKRP